MAKQKDEIIFDIKTISNVLYSTMGSTALKSSANKILVLLNELDSLNPGFYNEAINGLSHTIEEDIFYAEEAEREMNSKNAPKKSTMEFYSLMNKAIDLIHYNLLNLFYIE